MKTNKDKILLTGGLGYVGTALAEKLINKNYDLTILDKFYFGNNINERIKKKIVFVKADIRDLPLNLIKNFSVIIHLAGISNDPTADFNPKINFEINHLATIDLAKKAKRSGVKKFIFASSCSIYDMGMENESPLKNEDSAVYPKAPYSLSKHLAEQELLKLKDSNFSIVILRKGTVFGYSDRMRYDLVINAMIKSALLEGKIRVFCKGIQWRPILNIKDASLAYMFVLENNSQKINGQIINILNNNFQVKDLALIVQKAIARELKKDTEIIFEQDKKKDRSYRVEGKKAKELLGFYPSESIDNEVITMVKQIIKNKKTDFLNPIYYNIDWMKSVLKN
ncbi:MAG: SDR family oxidoreductase [Actinobacteria bacterium]|nr:SDR family oxidoreductase [Actinomycetota bacterium]